MSQLTASRMVFFAFAATALAASTGCSSLSPPFDKMKDSQMTVYRLQNFEPPPQPQAAATPAPAAGGMQLPPQIQQWIAAGASLLPPGLLPPGLVPGSAPPPPPVAEPPRFHGFRILEWQPVNDANLKGDIVDVLGHDSNFAATPPSCMYAELGFAIQQPNSPMPADVLVSLSCSQVQSYNFTWPYPKTGLTPDAAKKISQIAPKVFPGH